MSTEDDTKAASAFRFVKNAESILVAMTLALMLWMGTTVYQNSIQLATLNVHIAQLIETQKLFNITNSKVVSGVESSVATAIDSINGHLSTIWPRLREMKERVQALESSTDGKRANTPWRY